MESNERWRRWLRAGEWCLVALACVVLGVLIGGRPGELVSAVVAIVAFDHLMRGRGGAVHR